jgi:nitrate/TMAO reductase-like tetraheme cytochrome c subunit
VGVASAASACGRSGPPLVVAPATVAAAQAPIVLAPRPGPAPRSTPIDAVTTNAECARCHAEIAAEWRGSLHQRAYVDATFQAQLAREPSPFCIACHAPESDPASPVPAPIAALGVACTSCHVVGDHLLASPVVTPPPGRAPSPHPLSRVTDLGGVYGCGACHEFAFPDDRRARPLLMQSTVSEHAASAHADRSCADCHMPVVPSASGGTHRSHRFEASRNEAWLRRAAKVEAHLDAEAVVLEITPGEVGHAFPTGDMLRRLAVEVEVLDEAGEVRERHLRHLMRHFAYRREPHGVPERVLVRDDRVGAAGAPDRLRFAPRTWPAGGSVRWTLRYERVAEPGEGARDASVEGAVTIGEGVVRIDPRR